MQIRHHDLVIGEEHPFAACKLDREKYADVLTGIVESYPEGFVLAISNGWGTGKTTFVKMWRQQLINKDFKTIYFNAWENDFDLNPTIAIIAELKGIVQKPTQKLFNSVTKNGGALVKAVVPAVAKAVTKRYFDHDIVENAVEGVLKGATEVLEKEIDNYRKKKESISAFRTALEEFVRTSSPDRPVVFIIDELDRCRPNYAVEVLEQMKHFFSVPGITFALSIDKGHLAASVRGFYGSEQIDTNEYLRRFIDLEYSIPAPTMESFVKYLYEYFDFPAFFKSPTRLSHSAFHRDAENFLKFAVPLFSGSKATLRQVEKILGRTRLILQSFRGNQYVLAEALLVLVLWSVTDRPFYEALEAGSVSNDELGVKFGSVVQKDSFRNYLHIAVEARLHVLLHNMLDRQGRTRLIEEETPQKFTTSLKSKFVEEGSDDLARAIAGVYSNWDTSETPLSFLTLKVDLTEPLIFE